VWDVTLEHNQEKAEDSPDSNEEHRAVDGSSFPTAIMAGQANEEI
jgi:hypothetical protein